MKKIIATLFIMVLMPAAFASAKINTWKTQNGAKVFFIETHAIPVLDISLTFDAGSRFDTENKVGLAGLTQMMLSKGIKKSTGKAYSEAEISDAFADIGAEKSESIDVDKSSIYLRTLSDKAPIAIELIARMIAEPSFPISPLERDKARLISSIKDALTKPEPIASRAFKKALYGVNPYGFSATPETIQSISRADIVRFYERFYTANRLTIAIVGDATRENAQQIAETLSQRLANREEDIKPMHVSLPVGTETYISHPATQSHILIGMPALKKGDPDFFALTVGNYVLGGGVFASRLMNEVREKRGFAYSIHSYFDGRLDLGPFVINLQTKKEQTQEALTVVKDVLHTFLKEGITDEELQAAKSNLIESFPLNMDTNAKLLSFATTIGYYGLPLDYWDTWIDHVKAVSKEDVKEAFARKLNEKNLSTVIVGTNAK